MRRADGSRDVGSPEDETRNQPSSAGVLLRGSPGGMAASQAQIFYRGERSAVEPTQVSSPTSRGGGGGRGSHEHQLSSSSSSSRGSAMPTTTTRTGLIKTKMDSSNKSPYKKRIVVVGGAGKKSLFGAGRMGGGGPLTEREEILLREGLNNFLAVIQFEAKGFTLTGCQIDKEAVSLYPHEHLELIEVARRREEIEEEEDPRRQRSNAASAVSQTGGRRGDRSGAGGLALFHGLLPGGGGGAGGRSSCSGGAESRGPAPCSPTGRNKQAGRGGGAGASWLGMLGVGGGGGEKGGRKKRGGWLKKLGGEDADAGGCSVSIFKRTVSGRYATSSLLGASPTCLSSGVVVFVAPATCTADYRRKDILWR